MNFDDYYTKEYEAQFVLGYVPEAEYLSYQEAIAIGEERAEREAEYLLASILDD